MNVLRAEYNTGTKPGGISESTRARLALLHRRMAGPFTVGEAAGLLKMDPARTRRLLAHLAAQGWLARVRRNLYTTVPLEATVPSEWREDPWAVAARLFAPGYVGGWSACEHWALTDQLFRTVVVVTARRVRERHPVIQDTSFWIKVVSGRKLFGSRSVWRGQVRVPVSDPHKTMVDILDDPSVGGGIRHLADVVAAYFTADVRDDAFLLDYAERLGNRAVYKRLGYLIEALDLAAPEVTRACRERQSTGISLLDPVLPSQGRIRRRWNLRVNAAVAPLDQAG